ncbi:MAG: hypothetical protein RL576_755, partial [Actinomycetota bacterium]
GAITYTSSNTSVATIEANTGRVSIVGSGSFTIIATQTAWGVFKAPVVVTNTISVSNGTPQFSGLALPGSSYRADDAPFTVTAAASSNSPGAVTYSSSNTAIATQFKHCHRNSQRHLWPCHDSRGWYYNDYGNTCSKWFLEWRNSQCSSKHWRFVCRWR